MKIAVGLSGGVDSAVAALLLKREGHDVTGITMKLWREGRYMGGERDACFGPGEAEDIAAAEAFAAKLGIDYRVFDCSEEYEKIVLDYFRRERTAGRTPNPCIVCNRNMKFGMLPKLAEKEIGFDKFATGHYARIVERGGRLAIARAADEGKDQSYFLWGLSQEQIARAMFPLGTLSKGEVRNIAREAGLPMADKADSQDFYSGDSNELLDTEDRPGDIVTTDGKKLGRHRGYWHYTVGQRQGLGIGGGTPFYVVRVDACRNEVVVGRREDAVSSSLRRARAVRRPLWRRRHHPLRRHNRKIAIEKEQLRALGLSLPLRSFAMSQRRFCALNCLLGLPSAEEVWRTLLQLKNDHYHSARHELWALSK